MADKIELFIFDMDGLMIDTERLSQQCWRQVAQNYGYELPQRIFDRIIGMDNRRIVDVFKDELGADYPYEKIYKEKSILAGEYVEAHGVPVKAGLMECLDFVRDHDLHCAVASSTRRDRVCYYLEKIGILDRFGLIQSGEDIKHGKPQPDIFLTVCEKMGIEPAHAVVLEDSTNGLLAAKVAGIRSIWIPDLCVVPDEVTQTVWHRGKTLADVPRMVAPLV